MKKYKSILWSAFISMLAIITISACQDVNDWDVDSSYERLFTPGSLSISADATEIDVRWTAVPGAQYYIFEISKDSLYDEIAMGEHASSVVYGEDGSITRSPATLTNLDSDSKYFIRAKSVSSTVSESKWAYPENYSFRTRAEQIISKLIISANSVTAEWPANSTVTDLVVTSGSTTVESKVLTSDEIAAGSATIGDLTPETEYTVSLMNGTVTRGSRTFTTSIDLGGATVINPGDDDQVIAILTAAEEGGRIAFMPGDYVIDARAELTKSITIFGVTREGKTPTIKGLSFNLKEGAGLTLNGLILDGTDATGQLVNYPEDYTTATTSALSIIDCNVVNYADGFINLRKHVEVESMTISGNIINNVAQRLIDMQSGGYAKLITLEKNTISNSIAGDAGIRLDNAVTSFPNPRAVINIRNNTFYKSYDRATNRLLYVRMPDNEITLHNNLMTNSRGGYSDQSSTKVTEMANNFYFEAPNYTLSSVRVHDANGTVEDPKFVDPENGDFTPQNRRITNENIGDPRWHQ